MSVNVRDHVIQDDASLGRVVVWRGRTVDVQFLNPLGEYIVGDDGSPEVEQLEVETLRFLSSEEFRDVFHEMYPYLNFPPREGRALYNPDGTTNEAFEEELARFRAMHMEGIITIPDVEGLPKLPSIG